MLVIHGVHAFVPRMRQQQGDKHIVNVSSMSTLAKVPGHSTYVLTKAAVNGFSDVIREELAADGIGVTILYPGYVKTRIATSERLRPEQDRSDARDIPAYDSYLQIEKEEALTSPVRIQDAGAMQVGIDADEVGPMVVRAIQENRPYCLTHAAPDVPMQAQFDELVSSYVP